MNTTSPVRSPQAVTSDYLLGAHYFPGWKRGTHIGWEAIRNYPERTPALGYYDEEKPEIADWQIKWALEHGIGYFLYCWYRKEENLGRPVNEAGQHLGHAIHESLFHARFADRFRFAIMWEIGNRAGISSRADLFDNLLPYWIDTYFTRSNYLRIDGKPVLFVYWFGSVMEKLFGPVGESGEAVLDALRDAAVRRGLPGLVIGLEYRNQSPADFQQIASWKFDFVFPYCWHTAQQHPTDQQAIARQRECLQVLGEQCAMSHIPAVGMGWDPMPWASDDPASPRHRSKVTQWKLSPASWRELLVHAKTHMDAQPAGALARRMLLLDNWNEWSEGHYLMPQVTDGFAYLEAVRDVFTQRDNVPDHEIPASAVYSTSV